MNIYNIGFYLPHGGVIGFLVLSENMDAACARANRFCIANGVALQWGYTAQRRDKREENNSYFDGAFPRRIALL